MPAVYARFDGVPVRDKALAELLLQAEAQGFRLEESANGGHARHTGLRVYPPDPAHTPLSVGTAKSNPGHVANVRSALRQAGFQDVIDLTDTATTTQEQDMARKKHEHTSLEAALAGLNEAERPEFIAHMAASGVQAIGGSAAVAALVGVLVESIAEWGTSPEIATRLSEEAGGAGQSQVDEALALAEAAEARAVQAEQALQKAEQREQQARADCGAALDRAKAAEAERDRLDAALRPLRALLQDAS